MDFPFQFEGISNQQDIDSLKNYLDHHENDWGEVSANDYWKGRTLFYGDVGDMGIRNIMKSTVDIGIGHIKSIVNNDKEIYIEHLSMARWPSGYELLPHADAENPPDHPRHEFYWRDFACITFLNNDFEGGNLYFPDLNIEITPIPGRSICFPGTMDYLHGVKKITQGVRYTIASFLTYDISKQGSY